MKSSVRILLTVLGVAALVACAIFFVTFPLQRGVEADRERIRERRSQLVKLQRVARRIDDLQQDVERLEEALQFFENRLPEEREIEVILREVWLIAKASDLTERSVRTKSPEVTPRCGIQTITMAVEGSFEGFYKFLLGLEQLSRITKVREMAIQKSPVEEGTVQADVVMDIFFEKRP